jgi:uncharacterized protein (TIGR03437 family)
VRRNRPVLFRCSPDLHAGALLLCQIDINRKAAEPVSLSLTSSSAAVRVPAEVVVRPGSRSVRFAAYSEADAPAGRVKLSAAQGETVLSTDVQILASGAATPAPAPAEAVPVIEKLVNSATFSPDAVCSPGAAATILGAGFAADSAVAVNGEAVSVLVASASRVTFECPALPAGTPLDVTVRTAAGSATARTTMYEVAPGIFTATGTGAGYGVLARSGEIVSLFGTGAGLTFGPENRTTVSPLVLIDGIAAAVLSTEHTGRGVYRIDIRIPDALRPGDTVPLEVHMPAMDGKLIRGNRVLFTVE